MKISYRGRKREETRRWGKHGVGLKGDDQRKVDKKKLRIGEYNVGR